MDNVMGMVRNIQNSIWKIYSDIIMGRKSKDLSPKESLQPTEEVTGSVTNSGLMPLMSRSGKLFLRLSGAFGAVAVVMGAYGAHGFYSRKDISEERKKAFETANYYHFLHTLALLAVPLSNRPHIPGPDEVLLQNLSHPGKDVGPLFAAGMTIFCGTCYIYALTDNINVRKLTPYGGTLLIIAWLSLLF